MKKMHAWLYSVKIAENCMYIKEEKKMEKHAGGKTKEERRQE